MPNCAWYIILAIMLGGCVHDYLYAIKQSFWYKLTGIFVVGSVLLMLVQK